MLLDVILKLYIHITILDITDVILIRNRKQEDFK